MESILFKCDSCGRTFVAPKVAFPEPSDAPICCGKPMKREKKKST